MNEEIVLKSLGTTVRSKGLTLVLIKMSTYNQILFTPLYDYTLR